MNTKNDFHELVKDYPEIDEEDLRILLKARIEKPTKTVLTMLSLAIPVVLATMALEAFYTFSGYFIVCSFFGYLVVILYLNVRSVQEREVKLMTQYLKAKKLLNQNGMKRKRLTSTTLGNQRKPITEEAFP